MKSNWMRTDFDFGSPYALFTLDMRNPLCRAMMLEISALTDPDDPSQVQEVVKKTVLAARPELTGLMVLTMSKMTGGMRWEIGVAHPSLPRRALYEMLPRVYLEPCPVCKKSINADEPGWITEIQLFNSTTTVRVCSEACSKKKC